MEKTDDLSDLSKRQMTANAQAFMMAGTKHYCYLAEWPDFPPAEISPSGAEATARSARVAEAGVDP